MESMDTKGITAKAAWDILQAEPNAVLIDIRSSMEFLFVGHPTGAVHIPWVDEPDWEVNPHFISEVKKLILGGIVCSKDKHCAKVILICRSGNRSLEAGTTLLNAGLNSVFHIDEGFEGKLDEQHRRSAINGWRFSGLPWEQC
jgi:rhodanese-related sulfurtransferase